MLFQYTVFFHFCFSWIFFCVAACLDLECVPEGDWHCPNCIEKPGPGRKSAAGESSSLVRPIVIRLTRVVKTPESEYGGCVVCRLVALIYNLLSLKIAKCYLLFFIWLCEKMILKILWLGAKCGLGNIVSLTFFDLIKLFGIWQNHV